jgi:pyrrolidone-carboxylate peptidase
VAYAAPLPMPSLEIVGGTSGPVVRPLILKIEVLLCRFFGEFSNDIMNTSWLVADRVAEMVRALDLPLNIEFCDFPIARDFEPEQIANFAAPSHIRDPALRVSAQYEDIAISIFNSLRGYKSRRVHFDVVLVLGLSPTRETLSIERTAVPYWRMPNDPKRRELSWLREKKVFLSTLPNQAIIAACKALDIPMKECDIEVGDSESMRPTSCNAAMASLLDMLRFMRPAPLGGLMHVVFTPEQMQLLTAQKTIRREFGRELDVQAAGVILGILEAAKVQAYDFVGDTPDDLCAKIDNKYLAPLREMYAL